MNSFNDNSIEDVFYDQKSLSIIKKIEKEGKNSIELSKASQDSIKYKDKSNNNENSYKKIKKINDIISKSNKSHKKILSYKNSYFPIFLSSMTNTKNYINSIYSKFKVKNNSIIFEDKKIPDYKTIYDNSLINEKNNAKIQIYKKLDLKLNFPKSINENKSLSKIKLTPVKINQSRNIKNYKFDSSENKSMNMINNKNLSEFNDKNINIYNPNKIVIQQQKIPINNKISNEIEDEYGEKLRKNIKEINKFVSMNLHKKKIRNYFNEKSKVYINASMDNINSTKNDSIKNLKKINKNKYPISIHNTPKIIPKIINYNNPNVNKYIPKNKDLKFIEKFNISDNKNDINNNSTNNNSINNINVVIENKESDLKNNNIICEPKDTNKIFNDKINNNILKLNNSNSIIVPKTENKKINGNINKILNLSNNGKIMDITKREENKKDNANKEKIIVSFENNKIDNELKIKDDNNNNIKRNKKKKTSYMIKKKLAKKNKIKFSNVNQNIENNKYINKINSDFLDDIKDDKYKKFLKINKGIELNKVSMLIIYKNNLDLIITKQKEQFKNNYFDYEEDLIYLKKYAYEINYKNRIKAMGQSFIEFIKKTIMKILINEYTDYLKKCSLDMILLNYIRLNVEFSTIYLPLVNLGKGKSILITDKLFSFKRNVTIFQGIKSKFVETEKVLYNPRLARTVALNFITKELLYYTIDSKNINYLEEKENNDFSFRNKKFNSTKRRSSIFSSPSSLRKRASSYSLRSSLKDLKDKKQALPSISLLEKEEFFDVCNKGIEEKLKNSINNNLLLYKISGGDNKSNILKKYNEKEHEINLREKINKQYIYKAISLIHDHKNKKDVSSQPIDYFELLTKITGKENMQMVLRTFIKEGETLLFTEYFNRNFRRIDVNSQDEDGNTFLISSVKQGLNYITKFLLEKGVNVNIQNNEGNTALHYSLSGKNFDIADLLKKYGAKEDIYNNMGYAPWECVGNSIEFN